ncbi:helix-turn-helix domain-containing protein [Nonomuraea sp. JJY05]|uniref:helix-turn-helix domain-containing protein n=1 Tax=Nonomuraea sp. JJY05 TaxID=3350255 RepID=UPI00373DF7D7
MPKLLFARAPRDEKEDHDVRRLAGARHAPGDWIQRARIVVASWDGLRVPAISAALGCHAETVRRRLHRFNAEGTDGLGDRPGPGRRPRLTEGERSQIIALVKTIPPGRPVLDPWLNGLAAAEEEGKPGVWTLDSLTAAAQAAGIDVHRSQVRRILLKEGVRWRRPRSWTTSKDPNSR